ncbi:hypothetical protein SCARD494_13642 [Seiridium cardinale]
MPRRISKAQCREALFSLATPRPLHISDPFRATTASIMKSTWVYRVFRAIRAPETKKRYSNAMFGILLVPLIQLLVAPIQMALNSRRIDLPASILVMVMVTITMLFINSICGRTSSIYSDHMKGPVDFLGRHMSFGFVASFVMLSRDHITTATDIPRIAGAFVVTTLLSYVGSYLFAAGSYRIEQRVRGLRNRMEDVEKVARQPQGSSGHARRVSQIGKLTMTIANNGSFSSLETMCAPSVTVDFVVRMAPLWMSLFLLATIGLPVYFATRYELPFETFCFVFFWVGALYFQRAIKSCKMLELQPRLRSILTVAFNPVLVTSALATAYFWIKTAVTHRDIGDVLSGFKHHNSWASLMIQLNEDGQFTKHVGAGDLANALLDAGIVSLGFKMFEYRGELWKSFTTVFCTSLVFATMNVFINVIFSRAMGLQPAEALAFCARNVTIALGVPAVQHLDGSTTLMSALVVFSGMLFQMTGDLLFSWLHINDRMVPSTASSSSDSEKSCEGDGESDCKIIAAGVTVGINAAAMGTSHLIERNSKCAAYSALSMTVFGAITVALTAVPVIADVLTKLAAR